MQASARRQPSSPTLGPVSSVRQPWACCFCVKVQTALCALPQRERWPATVRPGRSAGRDPLRPAGAAARATRARPPSRPKAPRPVPRPTRERPELRTSRARLPRCLDTARELLLPNGSRLSPECPLVPRRGQRTQRRCDPCAEANEAVVTGQPCSRPPWLPVGQGIGVVLAQHEQRFRHPPLGSSARHQRGRAGPAGSACRGCVRAGAGERG